jgi:hypothetical protein
MAVLIPMLATIAPFVRMMMEVVIIVVWAAPIL